MSEERYTYANKDNIWLERESKRARETYGRDQGPSKVERGDISSRRGTMLQWRNPENLYIYFFTVLTRGPWCGQVTEVVGIVRLS